MGPAGMLNQSWSLRQEWGRTDADAAERSIADLARHGGVGQGCAAGAGATNRSSALLVRRPLRQDNGLAVRRATVCFFPVAPPFIQDR
jgi:hypothetical protein